MEIEDIREKLHQLIDSVDNKKAEAIYTLLSDDTSIDNKRRQLIHAERESYLKGEGKSFSWEEVKEMALNNSQRNISSNNNHYI